MLNGHIKEEKKWCENINDKLIEIDRICDYEDIFKYFRENDSDAIKNPIKDTHGEIGVYVFYNDNEVIYVGQGGERITGDHLMGRIKQHCKDSEPGIIKKIHEVDGTNKDDIIKYLRKNVKLTYLFADSKKDMCRLECYLIGLLNPKYNHCSKKKK